jgi:GntR family transcriptional regulator / MocR family aminotransferase
VTVDWANLTSGVDLHLDLDNAAGRRQGLERALREAIRDGRLAPGSRVPASRALAAEIGLARNTVAAAYDQLIAEGYLQARTGAGTFVIGMPTRGMTPPPAAPTPPKIRYDLRPGKPDVTTFPVAAWLRAARHALNEAPASAFDYSEPRGTVALRTRIADYLGRARGVYAHPDRVIITSGYVQALALLTGVLDRPTVAMEDPGLPDHREVVRRAGGTVVPIPVDVHGARTDRIPGPVRAVVVTAAHQYPTGVTLHPARRRAAVEWARANEDRLVIEDDYDGEFRFDRQPVGALQGTAPEHVVYIGTASKTLAPALRLAWMVVPERLVGPLDDAKRNADRQSDSVSQLTLAHLIASHDYDRHVRASRLRYRQRRDMLVERLGSRLKLDGIAAGLHALIRLPDNGPDERAVLDRATEHGLALGDLTSHWHTGGDHEQGLIVGYGTPGTSAYPAALDQLARVLRSV